MAWRPYANLIELNNGTPGKVTGWMRYFRRDMTLLRVTFDLVGDFREDIHGRRIRLTNPQPSDENIALDRQGTYAAGPRHSPRDSWAQVEYRYIEWYAEENGPVVLELDPLQVEVLEENGRRMRHEIPSDRHPVKSEAAIQGFLTDVRDAILRQRGKRRDKRASRKK